MRTPLASAAGCTVATALSTITGSSTGWTSRRILPETIRDTSSTSSTIWVSQLALRSSGFEAARRLVAGQQPAAQQPRVADDRVQRRPQLVRQHRQELVLHPVGVAGPRRAAARSRARPTPTPAMPSAIRSCCSVNTPTRELPKNRPPRTSPLHAPHRHGQVAAHRQVARRHAVKRRVLAEARVGGDVVEPDGRLAAEGRREDRGGARMRELREGLLGRARQRVEHVGVAGLGVAHVVEERAELAPSSARSRRVGDLLDDGVAIERRGDDRADLGQLLGDLGVLARQLPQAHLLGDVAGDLRGADDRRRPRRGSARRSARSTAGCRPCAAGSSRSDRC